MLCDYIIFLVCVLLSLLLVFKILIYTKKRIRTDKFADIKQNDINTEVNKIIASLTKINMDKIKYNLQYK